LLLPGVNNCCLLLQHVLYPKITVFLDHLITEFICCCIPVEFIGIGNKHHQYFSFGNRFPLENRIFKRGKEYHASICEPTRPAKIFNPFLIIES
jgi:hypothetical protein